MDFPDDDPCDYGDNGTSFDFDCWEVDDPYIVADTDHDKYVTKFKNLQRTSDVIIFCFTAISFCINCAVMVVYGLIGRKRKKIPNFLLFNQAIVDIVIAMYALMSTLPNYMRELQCIDLPCGSASKHYRITILVLGQYSVFVSLGVLMLTCGERFLALNKPFYHRRVVSKFKMTIAIIVIWLLSFIPCPFYISFTEGKLNDLRFPAIYGGTRVCLVFVGIIIIFLILFLTFRTVQKSIREGIIRSPLNCGEQGIERKEIFLHSEHKKEIKMIKIFTGMAAVYTISYLPMATFFTIKQFTEMPHFQSAVAEIVVFMMYISSAFLNPCLTLTLKEDYKKGFLRRLTSRRLREEHREGTTEMLSSTNF